MDRKKKEALQGIIYILPSFILIACFSVLPIFMSGYFSFTNYNVMNDPTFAGLENYTKIFKDAYVADAIKNTLAYVVITVPVQTILSLVFAAFLAYKMQNKAGGFLRSIMFIPVIASAVTAGTIWRIILNTDGGILNNLLGAFNISPVNWLGSTQTSLISICIVAIWKNVGYFLVIYYAGIMGISKDLYEAAVIDGANKWDSFRYITLPSLKPILTTVIILDSVWWFKQYTQVFTMTAGGPGTATNLISLSIYGTAFNDLRFGKGAAWGILVFIICYLINSVYKVVLKDE